MIDRTPLEKIPEWAKPSDLNQIHVNDIEIKWWEPHNLPWQIVRELRRRNNQTNIGQNSKTDVCIDFQNNYDKYRGGMTPWVRLFSNGTGRVNIPSMAQSVFLQKKARGGEPEIYNGFILEGEKDFYKGYGYKQNGTAVSLDKAIIGYQSNGKPHYIENDFRDKYAYRAKYRPPFGYTDKFSQNPTVPSVLPPPGISSVNIKTNKDMMSTATINWKCYGLGQLEYMMPFFLTPKINMFLEFGWNLFDIKSLVDLDDIKECYTLIKEPQIAIANYNKSFGNYGLITGIVHKYNFNTKDGFVYDCVTEIYSRQAMWSGWRPDSAITRKENNIDIISKEFVTLKEFFKNYLQFTKYVVKSRNNFIDWISKNSKFFTYDRKENYGLTPEQLSTLKKINNKDITSLISSISSTNQTSKFKLIYNGPIDNVTPTTEDSLNNKDPNQLNKIFYNGNPENRIFMGRYNGIYNEKREKLKYIPEPKSAETEFLIYRGSGVITELNTIDYGKISELKTSYITSSFKSLTTNLGGVVDTKKMIYTNSTKEPIDFDYEDNKDEEVWYQLDFVFEIINLFCSNKANKINYIDISDVIINAHPNLISCDKNVLIPNPIAPKINFGRPKSSMIGDDKSSIKTGFLKGEDESNVNKNEFLNFSNTWYWKSFTDEIKNGRNEEKKIIEEQFKPSNSPEFIPDIKTKPLSLWKAALKTQSTFKTFGPYRDNLDIIINKLYHDIGNAPWGSASFPQFKNITTEGKENKYEPYYYGYLKHLYISKTVLTNIGEDESLKTLEQIVKKILDTINESTGDFWKLDVILNSDGGIKIVDKSLTMPRNSEIYMFDIGTNSNAIKQINFGATLTNEQSNQVLYGSGNNSETYSQTLGEIVNAKNTTINEKILKISNISNSLPRIVFEDRLDTKAMEELTTELLTGLEDQKTNASLINTIPTPPFEDENVEIRSLQKYGKQPDALIMTFLAADDEFIKELVETGKPKSGIRKNYVFLNLPPSLKPRLLQMLDDGDTYYNDAKYSGPADNFTLTITFDGIMGFRMFQHFGISNLPKPYVPGNVIFMVTEVEHQINSGRWETVVTAMLKSCADKGYKFIPI